MTITAVGKSVYNDPALTARTAAVFKAAFGDRAVEMTSPGPTSEDFSEFVDAGVPSLFFNIGVYRSGARGGGQGRRAAAAGQPLAVLRPRARADDPTGVEAMTLAVMNVMTPPAAGPGASAGR